MPQTTSLQHSERFYPRQGSWGAGTDLALRQAPGTGSRPRHGVRGRPILPAADGSLSSVPLLRRGDGQGAADGTPLGTRRRLCSRRLLINACQRRCWGRNGLRVTRMVVGAPGCMSSSTASGAISAGRNVVLKERAPPRVAGWGVGIGTVSGETNDPSRLA